ncbi:MAG: polysaccharide export protein [Deltaproteobacteria bacterium]|nr:MAG: polysaccharide export protein [Deltaproteobacteria bacterium]
MRAALIAMVALAAGCRHSGAYVWADEFNDPPRSADYQIAAGDLLSIRVVGHEEMSTRVRVRTDGRISVPFLQDENAAGVTPGALADKLRDDFTQYVNRPVVTVSVEEFKPLTVSVTGEVMRPGVYPLDTPAGILQALASAGGLSQFAHDDQIYVLRRLTEGTVRIRFKYEALAHAEGRAGNFSLQRNDLVVVE